MSDEKRSINSESVDAKHSVDVLAEYTPEEVAKTWRKVDLVIMPVAALLYLASYIDRFVHLLLLYGHPVDIDRSGRTLGMRSSLECTRHFSYQTTSTISP